MGAGFGGRTGCRPPPSRGVGGWGGAGQQPGLGGGLWGPAEGKGSEANGLGRCQMLSVGGGRNAIMATVLEGFEVRDL